MRLEEEVQGWKKKKDKVGRRRSTRLEEEG